MSKSELTKKLYVNVFLNYLLRGVGIALGLLLTNLYMTYLGASLYGKWATILSFVSWINYGDFGIGNGFRNEFAKAVAQNDIQKQKQLMSSVGYMLGKLVIKLFVIFMFISEVLIALEIIGRELRLPIYITIVFFCIDMILGISRSAAYGYQKGWFVSLAQTITVLLRIFGVLLFHSHVANLVVFAIINGLAGVVGNIVIIIILLSQNRELLEINLKKEFISDLSKDISGTGIQFFLLQISSVVLYSTDNLIINKVFSSESVAKYDLITKVYSTGEGLFSIILVSLWSAVTYAVTKGDYEWVRKELKKILCIWGAFSLGVLFVSLNLNVFMKIWIGQRAFHYETGLIVVFAIYTIWCSFGSIFVNISNGIGRLKIQLICSSLEAIINIPLSIYFASKLEMGIAGVKFATLCCCIGANLVVPIDICLYLWRKKRGDDVYACEKV